jgi:hypothetical protein
MKSSLPYLISSILCVSGGLAFAETAATQTAGKKPQVELVTLAGPWPSQFSGAELSSIAPWYPPAAGEKSTVSQWSPQSIAATGASLAGSWQSSSAFTFASVGSETAGALSPRSDYSAISWALDQARKNQWEVLAKELENLPFDSKALTAPAAAERKPEFRSDLIFGGEINPVASPEAIKKRCEEILSLGFNSPVVPIRSLSGDWRKTYDGFFKSLDGRIMPMAGICLRDMSLSDLLALTEFAKRYECNFNGMIINYDLFNGQIDDATDAVGFERSKEKISLVLALIHRSAPEAFVWIVAGYYRNPDWHAWIKSFDAGQYSGVLLTGESAAAACMYPQAAAQVKKTIVEQAGIKLFGLVDFRIDPIDALVAKKDDRGLEQYESLRKSLKSAGIAPLHIGLTKP